MKKKWILIAIALLLGVIASVVALSGPVAREDGGGVIPLARAATSSTFLDEEAGIAAYSKSPGSITLQAAKPAYVIIEKETADYLIGWVSPRTGVGEGFNVRVYTAKDGWIVAYYLKNEATSKMIDWKTYSGGAFSTFLEEVLQKVGGAAGLGLGQVSYYHYGYPTANALLVLVGVRSGEDKSFSFKIPTGLAVSEISWSVAGGSFSDSWPYPKYPAVLKVLGEQVSSTFAGLDRPSFGVLTRAIPRDVPVAVDVTGYDGYGAVAIVYRY